MNGHLLYAWGALGDYPGGLEMISASLGRPPL